MSDNAWRQVSWADEVRTIDLGPDRISYFDLGEGDGTPVLLVHGLGGNSTVWLENLPAIARERRVLALDLPGFGASAPASDGISIPGYSRTLQRFCPCAIRSASARSCSPTRPASCRRARSASRRWR
jgi:pimeloyl-ACP methyl ester carboxylesterase